MSIGCAALGEMLEQLVDIEVVEFASEPLDTIDKRRFNAAEPAKPARTVMPIVSMLSITPRGFGVAVVTGKVPTLICGTLLISESGLNSVFERFSTWFVE